MYCRSPFRTADTHLGVIVQPGTEIETFIEVSDEQSGGFTQPQHRPNFEPARVDFAEDNGTTQFRGWFIRNRDENLRRTVRAFFRWEGTPRL